MEESHEITIDDLYSALGKALLTAIRARSLDEAAVRDALTTQIGTCSCKDAGDCRLCGMAVHLLETLDAVS